MTNCESLGLERRERRIELIQRCYVSSRVLIWADMKTDLNFTRHVYWKSADDPTSREGSLGGDDLRTILSVDDLLDR